MSFLRLLVFSTAASMAMAASSTPCDATISVSLGPCNISIDGQQTAYSWGALLVVNRAEICAAPSSFVASPLIEHQDVCSEQQRDGMTAEQCRSRRGNYVTSQDINSTASPPDLLALNPNLKFLRPDRVTNDPIQFQIGTSVSTLSGLITSGDQHTNSHLPLNNASTVLENLKSKGQIGARSFALDVGSQQYLSPRKGRLTLGSYQPAMVKGSFWEYKIDNNRSALNDRLCPFQVQIQEISLRIANLATPVVLVSTDSNSWACIEPYDRQFRLPSTGLTLLKNNLTASGFSEAAEESGTPVGRFGELLDIEPGLVFRKASYKPNSPLLADLISSMQIILRGGTVRGLDTPLTVELPGNELVQPLRGLNKQGAPVWNTSYEELLVYRNSSSLGSAPVLGRAFLEKLYMFVDYENSVFKLGHIDPDGQVQLPISSNLACDTSSSSQQSSNDDKSPWHIGLLGGLIGGICVVLLLGAGLAYFFRRKLEALQERVNKLERGVGNTPGGHHTTPQNAPSPVNTTD
ncbi:hypothetical protein B0H63DRAFT_560722 [Podospora didyma]|uniref:Peptidase A1 domain-containing protein n=1 Tax=Podospora didyma TaxID=330526 RepID=A0AAE0NG57_9PEZI|nr:hypothetical protein B0H63DRAFT_560722 [Podospora didyma]